MEPQPLNHPLTICVNEKLCPNVHILLNTQSIYMIQKTHHTHFGLFFRYLSNAFFISFEYNFLVDLAGSILIERKLPEIIVLWTQRIEMKMHLLHYILFTKHRSIVDNDIAFFYTAQFPMRPYSNIQMTIIIIIVYNCHVHICCEYVTEFLVGILLGQFSFTCSRHHIEATSNDKVFDFWMKHFQMHNFQTKFNCVYRPRLC